MLSQDPADLVTVNNNTEVAIVLAVFEGMMVSNKMLDNIEVKVLKEEGVVNQVVLDETMASIEVLIEEGGTVEHMMLIAIVIIEVESEVFQNDEMQGEIETVRKEDITRDVVIVIAEVVVTASREETTNPSGRNVEVVIIREGIAVTALHEETAVVVSRDGITNLKERIAVTALHEETAVVVSRDGITNLKEWIAVTALHEETAVVAIQDGIANLKELIAVTALLEETANPGGRVIEVAVILEGIPVAAAVTPGGFTSLNKRTVVTAR